MNPPPSQVVVGFDFSPSAYLTLQRAIALAARAPFHVLHFACVIEPHVPFPMVAAPNGVDYAYAEAIQHAVTHVVETALDGAQVIGRVHFFVHARIGHAATEILSIAHDVGADLILVGSNNVGGLTRLVLGSVAAVVAREAGCTVEVVRRKLYPHVDLLPIVPVEPSHKYVPPHRYSYEDHRLSPLAPDWPRY